MVQVIEGRIAIDQHGMHIGVFQKPSGLLYIVIDDLLKEGKTKLNGGSDIGLAVDMSGGMGKAGFGDQNTPGMGLLFPLEGTVLKKPVCIKSMLKCSLYSV